MKILVINGGSSSLKVWYHDLHEDALDTPPAQPLWSTHIDWTEKSDIEAAFASVFQALPGPVEVVGHRIVHGGRFRTSTALTPEVRTAIADVVDDRRVRIAALRQPDVIRMGRERSVGRDRPAWQAPLPIVGRAARNAGRLAIAVGVGKARAGDKSRDFSCDRRRRESELQTTGAGSPDAGARHRRGPHPVARRGPIGASAP